MHSVLALVMALGLCYAHQRQWPQQLSKVLWASPADAAHTRAETQQDADDVAAEAQHVLSGAHTTHISFIPLFDDGRFHMTMWLR